MAGITKEQAEAKLQTWMEAEEKIASGQGYSIGDRRLTRADLYTAVSYTHLTLPTKA